MTQEEKDLLLKDLSARLYTGTIVNYNDTEGCDYPLTIRTLSNFPEEKLKCYLRPMSSMTEKELVEYDKACDKDMTLIEKALDEHFRIVAENHKVITQPIFYGTDYLDANHFDYRGLIPKGLAIEVTKENNPYKFINYA